MARSEMDGGATRRISLPKARKRKEETQEGGSPKAGEGTEGEWRAIRFSRATLVTSGWPGMADARVRIHSTFVGARIPRERGNYIAKARDPLTRRETRGGRHFMRGCALPRRFPFYPETLSWSRNCPLVAERASLSRRGNSRCVYLKI